MTRSPAVEDVSTQLIPITGSKPFALLLHNILSPDECANLIRRAEDKGFDDALVQGPDGRQILRRDIRSCHRCIIDDAQLADTFYERIANVLRGTEHEKKFRHAPWLSKSTSSYSANNINIADDGDEPPITAVGLNERMRFLKYEPGHFFAPHQDLRYVRGPDCGERAGETSHITVQLYLNEKFKGGSTRFLSGTNRVRHYDVKPRTGSVLVFDHDLLHEGSKVSGGVKYSVRTDIMFTAPREHREEGKRPNSPFSV